MYEILLSTKLVFILLPMNSFWLKCSCCAKAIIHCEICDINIFNISVHHIMVASQGNINHKIKVRRSNY